MALLFVAAQRDTGRENCYKIVILLLNGRHTPPLHYSQITKTVQTAASAAVLKKGDTIMMTGYGMGFGVVGYIFMALFWLLIIGGGIWLLSNLFPKNNNQTTQPGRETALDILKQRYARGEINKEAYESMRYDLEQ